MRILMLSQFYPPIMGGEEQLVRTISTELVARGHDVAVATLWHEGMAEFEIDQGVRVYRIRGTLQRAEWLFSENGRRHAPPFPDPELALALRRVVANEQPEIVHAHNWIVHSFLPLKAWSGAKLVLSLHDYSFACAKKRLMYQGVPCSGPGLRKCLSCAADHYSLVKAVPTVVSNWAMGIAERAAVDMFLPVSHATAVGNGLVGSTLPLEVIPNFLPHDINEHRDVSDPRLMQLPADDYLLFVGDLSREKGIEVLLRAYGDLKNAPPLVLVGRKCADTPTTFPSNVVVLNSVPHSVVTEVRRRSILALVPSVWMEPFGIVAIEAMASGRPVIASRIAGLADIVDHEETGLLVAPGDSDALRQAIERLLDDPVLREDMGVAAKRRANGYQASVVIPRIEQAYQRVIEGKASAHISESSI